MVEFLPDGRLVGRERAADLAEDLGWGGGVGPPVGVGDQLHQRLPPVGVGDRAAQGPPQPFDPVGAVAITPPGLPRARRPAA